MLRIRKDDHVYVTTGKDKGKTGRVIIVFADQEKVVVENINVIKKAQRPTQANPKGGFMEKEMPIHISNVMLIDKKTNKPSRFGIQMEKGDKKVRISRKSGGLL